MTGPLHQPCAETAASKLADETPCPKEKRVFVLAASVLGSALVFIDATALTIALPAMRDQLGAGPEALNWIVNAYVLVLAAGTLAGGAAADRFGRKRVFVIGAAGFAIASALCALAQDPGQLIAGRVVQGLFGAALAPASLAMLAAAYPGEDRGAAIGTWAGASALTTAAGPVIAGALIDGFGWPSIFLINLPVAAGAVALAVGFSPETKDQAAPRAFDIPGAILAALALALIAWGLVGLGEGTSSLTSALAALGVGALAFAGFLIREHQAASPMVPLQLFAKPAFASANGFTLLAYAGLAAMMFVLPLNLVDVRGWSAAEIGLSFLPFTLAVGLLSRFFGRLGEALGEGRTLMLGGAIAASGFLILGLLHHGDSAVLGVWIPMALLGLGFAAFIPTLTTVAVSSAGAALEGVASGVNNAVARVAGMIGTAAGAALMAASLGHKLINGIPFLAEG
jgi:EmrB/QacA subfamily drug resistance transporter